MFPVVVFSAVPLSDDPLSEEPLWDDPLSAGFFSDDFGSALFESLVAASGLSVSDESAPALPPPALAELEPPDADTPPVGAAAGFGEPFESAPVFGLAGAAEPDGTPAPRTPDEPVPEPLDSDFPVFPAAEAPLSAREESVADDVPPAPLVADDRPVAPDARDPDEALPADVGAPLGWEAE